MIKLNEVNTYSKLASIIFFIGVFPVLAFYIGVQYQDSLDNQYEQPQIVNNIKVITKTEGCTENNNKRICTLKINTNNFYTFSFSTSEPKENTEAIAQIEVFRNNSLQQKIILPTAKFDQGYITDFMIARDVNVDGSNDLGIKTCEGATGNVCYDYFLFNPQTKLFEYSEEFSKINNGFFSATSD